MLRARTAPELEAFGAVVIALLLSTAAGFILAGWGGGVMLTWIATMLALLPVFAEDRQADEVAKAAQMRQVVSAVDVAARGSKWRASMLLAWGNHETHFSQRIGAGECRASECDRDRHGAVRAVSNWQLHAGACSSVEAWESARTDVNVAAKEAARAIDRARGMCRSLERDGLDPVRMAFSALAGRGCRGNFRGLDARVATFRRIHGAKL